MAGTPKSCTPCRQAKVGCDARRKPANTSCTRCTKNQLECRFDKNFKRILTRKLTANLTKELHQLRTSPADIDKDKASSDLGLREPLLVDAPFFFTNVTESLSDFSIGNITLPPGTIIELIQYFGYQYYAHAHFIQPIESLACFHTTSPLLFWTIVLISCRFHPEHSGLYERLIPEHEELLRPFSNTAIQSVHEIHALLLLCLWPIAGRPEWSSPTWNYIGLAVGACMRLDLDKATPPETIETRSNALGLMRGHGEVSVQTRRLTWLACVAISTQEASFLGLMPPLSCSLHLKYSRKAIDKVKDYLLPGLKPKFAIYELICNYSLVLEEVDGSSAQLSLVETFDSSLDRIKETYSAEWSTDVDMLLQYAKLNLNAAAVVRIVAEAEEESSQHPVDIQTLIIRGSEAASRLIGNVKAMITEALAHEGQSGPMIIPICYPRFYYEVIFFAAVFIFRAASMRPSTSRDGAVEGLIETYNIYRLFPTHPELRSGVEMIPHILRYINLEESSRASSPIGGLATTNRLGASFVWDTLMRILHISGHAKWTEQADSERQEPRIPHDAEAGSSALESTTTSYVPEVASGLPLPINLDWGDIDLSIPTFDIFGLGAGEHIIW